MTPTLAASLLSEMNARPEPRPVPRPLDDLTERERQILEKVAGG